MEEIERFLAGPSLSDATRKAYRSDLEQFGAWLDGRGLALEDVEVRVLTEYAAELGRRRPKLAPASVARKLSAVRSLLAFALGRSRVPDAALAPKRARRLPSAPKTSEVDALLEGLRGDGALGLRNRALVELIYSAGLRSAEAVGLDLQDVDFEQELVHVRGKGGKERAVPLGEEAAYRLSATSARAARSWREAPRTRSSSRRAGSVSTPARFGGSSRTRTGSATPSRRTCSRAAPTCA